MAELILVMPPFHAFPYRKWNPVTRLLCDEYRGNSPLPHIYFADFLEDHVARAVAREFPGPASPAWSFYKHQNEDKQAAIQSRMFPGTLAKVLDELNSAEFAGWLSDLTGILRLVPDPALDNAGLHRLGRGEFLNIRAESSSRHPHRSWLRRLKLTIYLTPDWHEEWGGALEFWRSAAKYRVACYPSLFNHAVISSMDDLTLQGFCGPLQCPVQVTRNSLVLYYYTVEDRPRLVVRVTDRRARRTLLRKTTALSRLSDYVSKFLSRIKTNPHH